MALVFTDGFDAKDYARKWAYNLAATTSTTTRYGAGASLAFTSSNGYIFRTFSPITDMYVGFAFMFTSSSGYDIVRLYGDSNQTENIHITPESYSGSNKIGVYRGLNTLGTFTLQYNVWYYIEIYAKIDATAGALQVNVNGANVVSYSGNTLNGTNTSTDGLWLLQSGTCYFDDLYVCDNTGTTNNTFLGEVRVQLLLPNGAGTTTQLAPTGSATNYVNVSEVPDSTSTYNSSATTGQRDTYAMSDALAADTTILGVQQNMVAATAGSGQGPLKSALQLNGTLYYGPTVLPSTSFAWYGNMYQQNPNTAAAWTVADVDGLEAGAEVA